MSRYRKLMRERLGRPFLDDEIVHHIDGDRNNNSEHNLAIMTRQAHVRLHARERELAIAARNWAIKAAADKLAADDRAAAELADRQARTQPIDPTLAKDQRRSWYFLYGRHVKAWREQLGWSRRALAQCAGVSLQSIGRYESRPDAPVGSMLVSRRLQLAFKQGGIEFLNDAGGRRRR
jgi:hypothetical protein